MLSTNTPWPLYSDLCISNPLIIFILSPNPFIPYSSSVCPGICCQWPPSSSGLCPALVASHRPRHALAAFLLPGWATSKFTVATPRGFWHPAFWPQSLLTLNKPKHDLSSKDVNLGQPWIEAQPLPNPLRKSIKGPDNVGLLWHYVVLLMPALLKPADHQYTQSWPLPGNTRQRAWLSFYVDLGVFSLLTVQLLSWYCKSKQLQILSNARIFKYLFIF